jgi:molecular chaperone HscA
MTLLQIQDPNDKQVEFVVGIDFGTTNSLVAFSENHKPFIIEKGFVPSILSFQDQWHVGKKISGAINISSIKRILGKTYAQIISSNAIDESLKIHIQEVKGSVKLKIGNEYFDPIYLASLVFLELKQIAEQHFGQKITKAVVTVPAYFDDKQKSAVREAANLAGIEVLRLLNEPTAAGFAYGVNNSASQGKYLVYDFGGGTFDISLLKIQDQITQVIAVNGDSMLGGDDIDQAIANHLSSKFNKAIPVSLARSLKETLANAKVATFDFNGVAIELHRDEYEMLALPIVTKTINLTAEILNGHQDVNGIILVGGSSRVPLVKKLLAKFELPILDNLDPDKAVALGAALQAENLSRSKSHVLIDVAALSLGVEVMGGLNEKIIPRNTPIPVCVKRNFTTYVDNQNGIQLHILQGEREFAKDCRSLGFFELKDIPAMLAGIPKIEVSFMIDADGLLYVNATEVSSGVSQELIVKTNADLTPNKVKEVLTDAVNNAELDHQHKQLRETILKAENLINKARKIVDRLANVDHEIELAIQTLQEEITTNDLEKIETAINHLDKIFSPICAEHFNSQISNLLKGTKV